MSFTRRLAAGLPVAGVIAFAALALTGAPAAATGDEAATRVNLPVVMTTPSCASEERGEDCGYGYGSAAPTDSPTTTPTRGGSGYGSEAPTTAPTPSASVDTVSPTPSVSPTTGRGVSPDNESPHLPVTGAPMGLIVAVGAVLIAGGAGAVYASRRRNA
ncbi:LPXTG cell wall anchor domain-containing protein [Actinoplanes sp. NPDC051494]|uniref:LPXTG cell wall anchor domain-containing protein n=1 Tax=Actinoplanes sp. NPDC051494 TaxID=3363907 RepID=UPI0037930A06